MATKAQERRFINTSDEHQQIVVKNIQAVSRRHGLDRAFSDFVEISAIALARLDQSQFEAREARYLQIIGNYERNELDLLVQAFSHLVMAFEKHFYVDANNNIDVSFKDILGSIYMTLDLGNAGAGQFFTPYDISLLMAKINMTNANSFIEKRGYVRLMEPAVGAGGMVIAVAQILAEDGFNYQKCMHATAIDIDIRCVHMAFIQFSLLHIPATVVHGNALTNEMRSQWYTPAHIMGGWNHKLRNSCNQVKQVSNNEITQSIEPATVAVPSTIQPVLPVIADLRVGQLGLF